MDFLAGLNPRQREAAEHVEGPLLVLAGAGSGKTRVITHRIAHLVSTLRVPPWSVLAVTFTNKAAGEMRDRVVKLLDKAGSSQGHAPTVATFHSFCVRLLRREGAPLAKVRPGFTPNFNVYDDDDQISVLKAVYKNLGLDDKFMQHRAALSRISNAKSNKESPEDLAGAATNQVEERLAVIYEQYQNKLRAANALDFDDLLLESVRLLRTDEETRARQNQRYEFLMVDEYQDTNRIQYELMRLLSEQRGNVAVVGDEDQSIYGWRGANIRNILDFERDFPGAKVVRLEQNYRSTKNILEAASAVVANNTERIGKWLWTESGDGSKVELYEAVDSENEALWIADKIESLIAADGRQPIAVLYRTNAQSRQIEEALRRYGRRYVVVGGFSFYQRAEVKDIVAYLKALSGVHDTVSLLRVINVPARGIGRTTVEQIEQYAAEHQVSAWAAIEKLLEERAFPARAASALSSFYLMMEDLAAGVESRPIAETLRKVLDRTGYKKMLEDDGSQEAQARMANLDELLVAAADADERQESLRDFLDHAALAADADSVDTKAQVSLLTMHNAKGLEFPHVFIAGLEEGLFPHSRSLDSEAMMEEERRLCYVGMTRAEKKLHLTWARRRRRFSGQYEDSIPSRFLKEVPKALIEDKTPRRSYYGSGSGSGYGSSYGSGQSGSGSRGGDRYGGNEGGSVSLFAEQNEVRETVAKNLYTGKTYNSVEAVRQFFGGPPGATPSAPPKPVATPPRPVASPVAKNAAPSAAPRAASNVVAFPAKKPVAKKFGPGSVVTNAKFGRGTVVKIEGSGDDAKITVSFPGHGLKKLVAKYAGIKIE